MENFKEPLMKREGSGAGLKKLKLNKFPGTGNILTKYTKSSHVSDEGMIKCWCGFFFIFFNAHYIVSMKTKNIQGTLISKFYLDFFLKAYFKTNGKLPWKCCRCVKSPSFFLMIVDMEQKFCKWFSVTDRPWRRKSVKLVLLSSPNPFQVNVPFLYPLKTSERTLARNELDKTGLQLLTILWNSSVEF